MTANPRRRRRRTWIGVFVAVLLIAGAVVLAAVGVSTLRHSQEGEAVGIDERPVVTLPSTPNAMVAARDENGDLASLAVVTLLPEGRGGTVVTVPVNADANAGLAVSRASLADEFEGVRADGVTGLDDFVDAVESMLSITIERSAVVGVEELAALIGPVTPAEVTLPIDVERDGEVVVVAGERDLSAAQAAAAITLAGGAAGDRHAVDVATWSALAGEAPAPVSETLPTDESGSVLPPMTVEETFTRLWRGPVQVRDLAVLIDESAPLEDGPDEEAAPGTTTGDAAEEPGTTDADAGDGTDDMADTGGDAEPQDEIVVVDRRDSLFVFSQISPRLVSTPNPALSFRLEIGFTDDQLVEAPVDYRSTTEVGRLLIGQLLFLQANVVSVDATPGPEGAPEITRVEVADEQFLDDMIEFAPLMFGESEVVLADTLIEGVDVVVTVGTDFLTEDRGNTQVVVVDGDAGEDTVPDATDG